MKPVLRLAIISSLILSTSGCVSMAFSGLSTVYQHHSLVRSVNHHHIVYNINHAIKVHHQYFGNCEIAAHALFYDVLLVGTAHAQAQIDAAEKLSRRQPLVRHVYNHIQRRFPLSLAQHTQDAWITSKIKTKLFAQNSLDPDSIKVVTEDGTVYLLGRVESQQGQTARAIAKSTDGVKAVVSHLHLISDD